ncbi:MAG: ABC transporter substrate-binding protein [Ruminiclostridium sp.]
MNKRIGKIALTAVLLSTSLMMFGCSSTSENSPESAADSTINEKLTVRVGEMRLQYPIKAAAELGYFKDAFGENVEVEVYNFASGPELIQALAAGEIDLTGSFGSTPVIAGIANGYPITVINGTTTRVDGPIESHAIVTGVDSGINAIEDLAGHSFGLQIGSQEYTAFDVILRNHNVHEGDYELANLSNADAYTTLLAGNVDAAVTCEPYIGKLVDTGNYKTIGWISEYNAGGGLQIANADFAKEHPDWVQNFLKAYIEVKLWAHESEENENTVLQIVADQIGIEPSDVKSSFDNDNVYFGLQEEDIQIIQDNIPYLLEKGTITKEVILSDYVDYSFLEAIGYKDYYLQLLEG